MKCLLTNKHQNENTCKELTYVLRYTFRELSTLNVRAHKTELWKWFCGTVEGIETNFDQLKVIFANPLVSNELNLLFEEKIKFCSLDI